MTRQTPRRTSFAARRRAGLVAAAALGVAAVLTTAGCTNSGNGDSQTATDTIPGPPLPQVELPANPELHKPFGVQFNADNVVQPHASASG